MKKLILLLLVCYSCSATRQQLFVVQEKKQSNEPCMCEFWFNTPGKWPMALLPNYSYAVDSCSKFDVGKYWLKPKH